MQTKKTATKKNKTAEKLPRNVAVEIPLRDGSVTMVTGELVRRTPDALFLVKAALVKDTGRRNEFFAGRFDSNVEIEPYPDAMGIELPAEGAIVYDWTAELPRAVR